MPVIRIKDLAEVMIEALSKTYGHDPEQIEIVEIGSKPGEKLYEELMSREETRRSVEFESFFSVLPAFRGIYRNIKYDYTGVVSEKIQNPYDSSMEAPLSKESIRKFLEANNLLDYTPVDERHLNKRYWPGEED